MNDLDLPITFLDIEDLAQRWKCRISTIEVLAETDKLKFCIRPAALELALAGTPPAEYDKLLQSLSSMYIDHRYIYMMFADKSRKIEIACIGNYDVRAILKYPLRVGFFDLIIPIEQIEEFEFMHRNTTQHTTEFELLSDDFTCFIWNGQEYRFGEMQAKVIKRLWQAREDGKPWVYGKYILRDIGSTTDRIRNIFSHNKQWRRIIQSDKTGKYKLNLPPKQMTLFG
jgi:hypothetical protein